MDKSIRDGPDSTVGLGIERYPPGLRQRAEVNQPAEPPQRHH
jgi:hypothetical protein